MWTTGVQGFDTLPHVHPFPLSKWLHMFIRCLHRRSADGTLVLHHGSKAARPSQGIAWEMPTSSHLQPDKVAMKSQWIPWKSQWIPWKSHEYPIQVARNSWVLHVLGWRSGSTSLRTTARQAKALWFYTSYMNIFSGYPPVSSNIASRKMPELQVNSWENHL